MKKILLLVLVLLGSVSLVNSAVITSTLGEFSSPYHETGTYSDFYDVGVFSFDLMGESVISANISGTWGNSSATTTAHNSLYVDGVLVANTYDYDPSPYNTSYTDWSFDFMDFSLFADGLANFVAEQTSEYVIRLGETILTLETAPVPEPSTIILMGAGLLGLVFTRRKMKK